ncbi:hypothetical protein G7Z17_g2263 [Cylindrodendrum hubeiense]|uniref:Uncharacterized protein n=1 Tax=Cylindrodendrum hubeiense TaxID=595255 RepID=A0A9P5HD30_9HYPO|nr:hypothetical protein G7Z17_g2263 [Cylindrodendrum hubeiense]
MENFVTYNLPSIKEEGKIYSATGSGKIPFVSVDDVAAGGFHTLTSKQPPNSDYLVLGPELLTYADIAAIISFAIATQVVHAEWTIAELEADSGPLASMTSKSKC